jgi:hypothetical protein
MKDKLIHIYLDRDQCDDFNLSYFGEGTLVSAASAILRSKRSGYDSFHRSILEPLGGETITLTKTEADNPGWYLLVGYTKNDFPGLKDGNA